MNFTTLKSLKIPAATAALALCACLLFSASVAAQTTKRKPRRALQPIVVPTPLPQQSEPVVVSRAEDNQIPVYAPPVEQIAAQNANASDDAGAELNDLKSRVKSLEAKRNNEYDEKQKRLLLNLDILTRAETRSESLRKQMFDMIEKESSVKTRLEQLENDLRPEMIDRSAAFSGSLRPEEIREARRKNMANERTNLQNLLTEIQNNRANLESNLQKSNELVEKLRIKLEKDIDAAITDEPKN